MYKLSAIARYELLMAWRRRSLPILWLMLVLSSLAFALVIAPQAHSPQYLFIDPAVRAAADSSGWTAEAITMTTQESSQLLALMLVFNLALVLIVSETIPLDRQFRVRELLDALPINRTAYLGGKVLSVLGGVTLIVLTGGAMSMIVQRLMLGDLDLRVIALLWLALALPVCWANGASSVLASAFRDSRRIAVTFSLLMLPLFFLILWDGLLNLTFVSGLIHPVYIRSITSLMNGESPTVEIVVHLAIGLTLLAGITLLVWTLVWALLRVQDAR